MADRVGQQLGNYRLVRLLGRGGFAEVYLGEHLHLDTPAAIKVLRTELADDDVQPFRTEARTIARLVHPHIVRVLDFGVEEAAPYLVMDYAPNGTLRKRHPKGVSLPLSTVVSYVTQIADALQYAHDQGVIHRDIKPENMLLGRRNEILLSDFGIALVVSSRSHSTQGMQDLVGTIAYMAPEQIHARAVPSSDQYALGVVVYEWLSGTRPFQGTFTEVAVKQTLVPPSSLREKVPTLSTAVEEVVMKTLAKDPKQRFASVQEFASALQQAYQKEAGSRASAEPGSRATARDRPYYTTEAAAPLEELSLPDNTIPGSNEEVVFPAAPFAEPVLSSPLPSTSALLADETQPSLGETSALQSLATPVAHRGVSRRAVLLGLAGAAATVVGGGIAWLTHMQGRQGGFLSSPSSTGPGTRLYTYHGHSGWVWSVAWSPAGLSSLPGHDQRIASASADKTVQVCDATNGGNPYVYTGHSDSVYAVAWSPDGKHIASAGYDTTVQVWDAAGGHPATYSGHSSWVWSVAWSPDSRRIASAGGDKTVRVWDAVNGGTVYTYSGHSGSVYAVAWAPDGPSSSPGGAQRIASAGADGTVQIWNAAGGTALYTYQPSSGTLIWSLAWSPDGKRIASAGEDKTVQVWDAANGDHLYIYYGHSDPVYAVAWSPDGKRIASASADKTVQVWDAADGSHAYTYSGHSDSVRAVTWSPNSKRLASGSWDKTVQVWQAG